MGCQSREAKVGGVRLKFKLREQPSPRARPLVVLVDLTRWCLRLDLDFGTRLEFDCTLSIECFFRVFCNTLKLATYSYCCLEAKNDND